MEKRKTEANYGYVPCNGTQRAPLRIIPRLGSGTLHSARNGSSFMISVKREDRYEIIIQQGVLAHIDQVFHPITNAFDAQKIVFLSDENVAPHYLPKLHERLSLLAPTEEIVFPAGETSKAMSVVERCWQHLLHRKTRRRVILAAVGGGVACDTAGFIAATYLRGVPYVNIATSLMAQVDGAIGGKVGVDMKTGKNLIGAFHHPCAVVIDPDSLRTLPCSHLRNGLAEVVKVALISSNDLFEQLERLANTTDMTAPEVPFDSSCIKSLIPIIQEAVSLKLSLLADDPFEQDLRRLLNLGHAIGHTLEAITGYERYLHGQAVSIGIATVSAAGAAMKSCSSGDAERIINLLRTLGLPVVVPEELVEETWEGLQTIRMVRNGNLLLVLPAGIGQCRIVNDIAKHQFEEACAYVRSL